MNCLTPSASAPQPSQPEQTSWGGGPSPTPSPRSGEGEQDGGTPLGRQHFRLLAPPLPVSGRCFTSSQDARQRPTGAERAAPLLCLQGILHAAPSFLRFTVSALWRLQLRQARAERRPDGADGALVTGTRIKIGYQTTLKLLRAGAHVLGTTRFPNDAARRFAAEPDFAVWGGRLRLFALDLRHLPAVEQFATALAANLDRLDVVINNAAQTIRRPPAFYRHLLDAEGGDAPPRCRTGPARHPHFIPVPVWTCARQRRGARPARAPTAAAPGGGRRPSVFSAWLV